MNDTPTRGTRHRIYVEAFQKWFDALSPSERDNARALGIDKPIAEQFGIVQDPNDCENNPRRFSPRDIGRKAYATEPATTPADPGDENAAAFADALEWCMEKKEIVAIGLRLIAVLAVWRPCLIADIRSHVLPDLLIEFHRTGNADRAEEKGAALGPVLAWARRGTSIAQIGIRACVIAYVIRPTLIDGQTLSAIGERGARRTRQAIDKLAQDFRDTFGGIRSRTMRSEQTRQRCRLAQLSPFPA